MGFLLKSEKLQANINDTLTWLSLILFKGFNKRGGSFEAILIGTNFRFIGDGLEKSLGSRHCSLCGKGCNNILRYHHSYPLAVAAISASLPTFST